MLSKSPLEPQRELASAEDAAQALRLAIIAELDAINLYKQLATAVKDDRVRRVLEDVTNEERTHFGEFLSLLKELDPQQAKELEAGAKEVAELLGKRPSDPGEQAKAQQTPDLKEVPDAFLRALQDARRLRAVIPLVSLGPGAIAAPRGSVKGVGLVTYQYLRMMGGVDTTMPDRVVKAFLARLGGEAGVSVPIRDMEFIRFVEEASPVLGLRPIEVTWLAWLVDSEGEKVMSTRYSRYLDYV